jgi:predicted transcriptional regulator
MKQTTVRIDQVTHSLLKDISRAEGTSMQAVIQEAVEQHRRQRFLEAVNRGYAALRADPAASAAYDQELQEWEMTLADGLEDYETSALRARRQRRGKKKKRP